MLSLEKNYIVELNLLLAISRHRKQNMNPWMSQLSQAELYLLKLLPAAIYPAYLHPAYPSASKILQVAELYFKANNHQCQFALKPCSRGCQIRPQGREQAVESKRTPSSEVSAQAGLLETCPVLSKAAKSDWFLSRINSLNTSVVIKYMGG